MKNTSAPMTVLAGAGRDGATASPVDLVGDEHDVGDGQHAGDDGDHGLHPHDQVEADHAAARW